MQQKDIFQLIESSMPTLSKGQKRIAEYILDSYDKAAFMTANKLGKKVNASESTVVRFATRLGYDGYPAMQKALQTMVRSKLTAVQRIQVARDRMDGQDVVRQVMQADMDNIRMTLEECSRESFYGAVDALIQAKRIYILGVRSSSALSSFLGFYFHLIFDNVVTVHSNSASEMFEQLLRVGPQDAVVGISFPRYTLKKSQAR
ncbi:MAG: MurR/RpiR family transcriptional regulator, partial [Oscillospiraceae bacterium]|nr:MurR/RpiR family transcriptional regulator [Oscillospiraceae bacterium]